MPRACFLAATRAACGAAHPDVADALLNLSSLRYDRGEYEEAAQDSSYALQILREAGLENGTRFAKVLNNLGMAYHAMGRNVASKPLLEQALEHQRTALGDGHPEVAGSLMNLGVVCAETGQYACAKKHYEEAHEIMRLAGRTSSHRYVNHAQLGEAVRY